MCELLGMSANVPTDICFSFAGLLVRGGKTGPHKDGWGMAMHREGQAWCIHDPRPSAESDMAEVMSKSSLKCDIVISHIRQANVGDICLANTHPFHRQLWGETWSYAHNGQLDASEKLVIGQYQALGNTDSETAFCWLLDQLLLEFGDNAPDISLLADKLQHLSNQLHSQGVFNMMLTDGESLFCYCSTNLYWITRRAPFNTATLLDKNMGIDFQKVTTDNDVVTVIATQPLTQDEAWQQMQTNELAVFQAGEMIIRTNSSV